jgi:cytochrome b
MTSISVRVWDAPTRLFHWAIVVLIAFSWFSIHENWMELHLLSGYATAALVLFRLIWGFTGSQTARFSSFLASPLAGLRHLSHLTRREPDTQIGHNAAGGWVVLVMLLVLAVQVLTGLCANDDVLTEGPLAKYVGKRLSDRLSVIHAINFNIIEVVIVLHVLAIVAYAVLKRHNLVRPMITGRKQLPQDVAPPRMVTPLLALAVFACAVGIVAFIAAGM